MKAADPRLVLSSLAIVAGCVSCSDETPAVPPPPVEEVQAIAVSPRNSRVTWSYQGDATIVVERRDASTDSWREVGRKAAGHGRFLDLALLPETSYVYRLNACNDDACAVGAETQAITTQPSRLPAMDLLVGPDGTDDDVVVFGVFQTLVGEQELGRMAGVARDGTILWEFAHDGLGPVTEVQLLAEGTLAIGLNSQLTEIDLDGEVLYARPESLAHHDIDELSDGRLVYLTFDSFELEPGVRWLGDGLEVLNAARTGPEWSWSGREHIPLTDFNAEDLKENVFGMGQDWTHGNAITFDESAQKIYVNIRNLNRIYKIDFPSGQVDWIMGDGGDFGAGIWSHSHDPLFLADNRFLMLDNGLFRAGGGPNYSRVIEVEFDPEAKTAEVVWEYRETPDFFSLGLGAAHVQPNGNVFITDGVIGRLLEVTRDKRKVWEFQIGDFHHVYKAITVPRRVFTDW